MGERIERRPVEPRRRSGRCNDEFLRHSIGDIFYLRGVPGKRTALLPDMRPIQLKFLASRAVRSNEQLIEKDRLIENADGSAVARRHAVDMVGRPQAACAGMFCTTNADCGKVPAHVTREQAAIGVVAGPTCSIR